MTYSILYYYNKNEFIIMGSYITGIKYHESLAKAKMFAKILSLDQEYLGDKLYIRNNTSNKLVGYYRHGRYCSISKIANQLMKQNMIKSR